MRRFEPAPLHGIAPPPLYLRRQGVGRACLQAAHERRSSRAWRPARLPSTQDSANEVNNADAARYPYVTLHTEASRIDVFELDAFLAGSFDSLVEIAARSAQCLPDALYKEGVRTHELDIDGPRHFV